MNARPLIAVAALAVALAACSDDTGILVEIHGEELQQQPVRIDTMVIIDGGQQPDSAMWGSADLQQATVDVDVRATPHTVMLQPDGVAPDTAVWVAALAYDGAGNVIGWGQLDGPIAFEQDLVKRVAIDLHPAARLSPGCIVKGDTVVSRTDDDCDDDGFDYAVDCDDLDAQIAGDTDMDPVVCDPDCDQADETVYPGAPERCDGVDTDCDPASGPPPIPCALVARDIEGNVVECAIGQAACDDGEGRFGECMAGVNLPKSDFELCAGWADCDVNADPTCFADHYLRCELETGDFGACVPGIHELRDLVPDGQEICNWSLAGNVQQLQWDVGLRPRGDVGQLLTLVSTCDAEFVVQAAPDNPTPRYFVLTAQVGAETLRFALLIHPKRKDCTGGPTELACTELDP